MSTVDHDAGDPLSDIILEKAELTDVEHSRLVVEPGWNRLDQ